MKLLVRWGIACVALLATIRLVPGMEMAGGPLWIALATLALGFLNVLARPIVWLMKALTIPLSCLTFGLWNLFLALLANALIFYYVGAHGWGFRVHGFGAAILGALVMSAISALLNGLLAFVRGED
jgi:putative membrane protein